jgi:hypothetical protein
MSLSSVGLIELVLRAVCVPRTPSRPQTSIFASRRRDYGPQDLTA